MNICGVLEGLFTVFYLIVPHESHVFDNFVDDIVMLIQAPMEGSCWVWRHCGPMCGSTQYLQVLCIVYCVLFQANHRPSGPFTVAVMPIKYKRHYIELQSTIHCLRCKHPEIERNHTHQSRCSSTEPTYLHLEFSVENKQQFSVEDNQWTSEENAWERLERICDPFPNFPVAGACTSTQPTRRSLRDPPPAAEETSRRLFPWSPKEEQQFTRS